MLSDPKRLRTPGGHGYLVGWKHRLRVADEERAVSLARRILEDPANLEAVRAGLGQTDASMDELMAWLVSGLVGGALALLKTRVEAPVMDRPPETDLFDLLPPQEPKPELESLTFEVVDGDGEGVAVRYVVHAPSGDPAGSLPAGERWRVGELEPRADVELELSAILLPLREEGEEDEEEDHDDSPSADDDGPAPVGPGGEEPERPRPAPVAPVGPGGEEPARFTLHRTAPAPLEVSGALALPGQTPEPHHFIPAILCAARHAQTKAQGQVWVVSHGPAEIARSRTASIEAVVVGERDVWVELATGAGSLDDTRRYFAHLRAHRGWSAPSNESAEADVEAFQVEYNERLDSAILEDGICGTQTLGAVFDVLRDELQRWLPMFGLAPTELAGGALKFVSADALPSSAVRRPPSDGMDVWVFDPHELPAPADLAMLYNDVRAEVVPIDVPWSFERDELVVRLRAESPGDLAGYVSVLVEGGDGAEPRELPIQGGALSHDLVFENLPTAGRYTVSLVAEDGRREVIAAGQPFSSFLDDRGGGG